MPVEKTSLLEKTPSATVAEPKKNLTDKETNQPAQLRRFALALAILAVCFVVPLYQLTRFALGSELYSYIILMPVVTWYLIHLKRNNLPQSQSKPMTGLGIIFFAAGAAMLGWYFQALHTGSVQDIEDKLAMSIFSLFLFCFAASALTLKKETFLALSFPVGLLIFMVPMPVAMMNAIETFLQYGSAAVAHAFFKLAGTTVVLTNLTFRLPGGSLIVAPECSGIHSSLILFITSLMAGYLFLRSPCFRAILTLAVLPLALLRNGFRVFTIGELCVHIDWSMVDSYIHHHGGPIFFALSMIPFFALLILLYRFENPKKKASPTKI